MPGCTEHADLHFHHIDPKEKQFTIARGSSFNDAKFWEEIEKCQLMCETHHKQIHAVSLG